MLWLIDNPPDSIHGKKWDVAMAKDFQHTVAFALMDKVEDTSEVVE